MQHRQQESHGQQSHSRLWGWVSWGLTRPRLDRAVTVVIIAAASVAVVRWYRRDGGKKEGVAPASGTFTRSLSLAAMRGGQSTMLRLLDAQHAHVDSREFQEVMTDLKAVLWLPDDRIDFLALQKYVARVEMSGKEAEAVELIKKRRNSLSAERTHEAYELDMLIVEMLIYQGDFKTALNCECLKDEEITDARRPLYKAIIYTMLGDEENGKKHWEDFKAVREVYEWPCCADEGPSLHAVSHNFEDFQRLLSHLKKEIADLHKRSGKA